MADELTCGHLFYADDAKLYSIITCVEDCIKLQANLEKFNSWCQLSSLPLNSGECSCISYSRSRSPILYDYSIDGVVLARSQTGVDLGVVFDSQVTFYPHIEGIIVCTSRTLGFIFRLCKSFNNISTMQLLFNALVKPKVDYCSVWSPMYKKYSLKIDAIQKRFLKYLVYRQDSAYPEQGCDYYELCTRFNCLTFEQQRMLNSVIFIIKVIRGLIDCPSLVSAIRFRIP